MSPSPASPESVGATAVPRAFHSGACLCQGRGLHVRPDHTPASRTPPPSPASVRTHARTRARARARTRNSPAPMRLWCNRKRGRRPLRLCRLHGRSTMKRPRGRPCARPAAAASAPGLGLPPCRICTRTVLSLPHPHRDYARLYYICTGTGLTPPTSAPGLRSPYRIRTGTGLARATSTRRLGSRLPDLHARCTCVRCCASDQSPAQRRRAADSRTNERSTRSNR
jgi:hypothetical protein